MVFGMLLSLKYKKEGNPIIYNMNIVATASTSKEDTTLDSSFSSLFRNLEQSSDPGESQPTA